MYVYYSEIFKKHTPPFRHPEAPDRLDYVIKGVVEAGGVVKEPKMREDAWRLIYSAHDKSYVEYVKRLCGAGQAEIDGDTYVSAGTCDAAALAVSAVMEALDKRETALVAARPPGHHAGFAGRALTAPTQGFCIFNTAAIGALYGGDGIAVVDIDVHHGNGTQEMLYERDLLYISTHQHPATLYPGTGYPDEVGTGRGEGFNANLPLPPGTGDDLYIKAIDEVVLPLLRQYDPRAVIVSLGWDAHKDDPLADLALSLKGYLYALSAILSLQKPTIFLLEGGYNREVLQRGTKALVRLVAAGDFRPEETQTDSPPHVARRYEEIIQEVRRHLGRYWRL
ncbi:histone deacetylase family protein [Pyrobaculum sp.]|uniref:histone deacetylase family protein n=1 Tax=Pyrobaculum sp. TaxID=2004705 RepID=UPI0031620250